MDSEKKGNIGTNQCDESIITLEVLCESYVFRVSTWSWYIVWFLVVSNMQMKELWRKLDKDVYLKNKYDDHYCDPNNENARNLKFTSAESCECIIEEWEVALVLSHYESAISKQWEVATKFKSKTVQLWVTASKENLFFMVSHEI